MAWAFVPGIPQVGSDFVAGNPNEYESIVGPIEDRMIRSIWRIVPHPDDAQDVFQDAVATVWRKWKKIRRHPNPRALILRMCANAAYDFLKRRWRQRGHVKSTELSEEFPAPGPSARETVAAREEWEAVQAAIRQLPPHQAQAVLMRFVQDLSYPEIAEAMGCSEVTVRTHVARARAALIRRRDSQTTQLIQERVP